MPPKGISPRRMWEKPKTSRFDGGSKRPPYGNASGAEVGRVLAPATASLKGEAFPIPHASPQGEVSAKLTEG